LLSVSEVIGGSMETDALISIIEHGGLAVVLYLLLMRVMNRLDIVTDKLIEIADRQAVIHAQLEDRM